MATVKGILKTFHNISEEDFDKIVELVKGEKNLEAIRIIRNASGLDLINSTKLLKRLVKEELNLDILEFVDNY